MSALVLLSVQSEMVPAGSEERRVSATRQTKLQVGVASWYGEECAGNPTASGEIFDMNGLTAAHRVLPLGTRIRVTNLRNNKSVVLRVNDRGPGVPGRLLDVSVEAARRLGFKGMGLTQVQIEVVDYPKGHLMDKADQPVPEEVRN